MQKSKTRHASWQELLASPVPASHIVQFCDSEGFLASAVTLFAGEGLRAGEAVVLAGTDAHQRAVRRALVSNGLDLQAAVRSGQLVFLDAHQVVAAALDDGRLDCARLAALGEEILGKLSGDVRYAGVRCWGEISNVMLAQGNTRDALAAEDVADRIGRRHDVRLFCSYHLDRFDPAGYGGILSDLCAKHTHAIPADDYVRHRIAVNRAIAEVIGEIKGPLLQSLLSWQGLGCELPSSQSLLFWLREAMPEDFPALLAKAREHHVKENA
jgi:hypothetical protein